MKNLFKAIAAFFGFNNAIKEEPKTKQKPKKILDDTDDTKLLVPKKESVTKKTSNTTKTSKAKKTLSETKVPNVAKTSDKAKTNGKVKKDDTTSVQDVKKKRTGTLKDKVSGKNKKQ